MTPDRVRDPERPLPLPTLLLTGAQHCAVILGVGLAMPLIVLGRGDLPAETIRTMMSLGLIALAVATLLQIRRGSWFGSGFLAPATFTAAYLPPCIAAMEKGGPPLVMGMLMLAGSDAPATAWLGALTLALIAGLSVWGKGGLRLFATLIGIGIACLISAFTGALDHRGALQGLPLASIAVPVPAFALPAFDATLVPAFLISAAACSLRAMATSSHVRRSTTRTGCARKSTRSGPASPQMDWAPPSPG